MKILIVLTSNDKLGNSGQKTGFWLEEFASPYYVFKDAGAEITLASPKGGQPPQDLKSDEPEHQTQATERFKQDDSTQAALENTVRLFEVSPSNYDAIFYPGGHGPLWDLIEDPDSIALIETMFNSAKPVAAVCHGPAMLINAKTSSGSPIVDGKSVTGFSNSEEDAVQLTEVVPFLLENELKRKGGVYSCAKDWHPYVITDGNLITGQNPASSELTATTVLDLIK